MTKVARGLKVLVMCTIVGVLFVVPWTTGQTAGTGRGGATTRELDGQYMASVAGDEATYRVSQAQAPGITIVAPTSNMGDYGANNGNVWDMAEDDIEDIVAQSESFPMERRPDSEGTVVRGDTGTQVLGMATWASSKLTFPATQYHHLIYRLKIQAQSDCWTNGRVAYSRTWPGWYTSQVSSYPFVPHIYPLNCPYGTFCIYYLDLARNNNYSGWPTWHGATSVSDPSSWLSDPVHAVAIVPNEICVDVYGPIGVPDYFDLDFVYLTGDIVAREEDNYVYTVLFDINAPDSDVVTSTLRYREFHEMTLTGQGPSCDSSNFGDGTWQDFDPVAQTVSHMGPLPDTTPTPEGVEVNKVYLPVVARPSAYDEHEWYDLDFSDDGQFTDGKSYYICIQADDGQRQTYRAASAPIVRVPRSPWFGPD